MAGTINLTLPPSNGKFSSNPVFSVSGSFGHGNPLTITSSRMSFGTKALPLAMWETFQSGNVGDSLLTYNPNWIRYNGPNSLPGGARISNDHARYIGSKSAYNDSANGFSTNYKIIPATRIVYGSHWAYVETRGTDTGTMSSTTTSGFVCTGKSWTTDNWAGYTVVITAGRGSSNNLQPSVISSNTGNTIVSTLGTTGNQGWWNEVTVTGVSAGVDVPFTITSGEVGVDTTGGGDSYGTWTTTNGTVRLGNKIRVRCTSNGVDGVVKVGADSQNPVFTLTAPHPDNTSVFKIVPQLQLKQHRFTATPASGGSSVTNPNYGGIGTHALSSWAFQSANTSFLEVIDKPAFTALPVSTPVDGWYRVETRLYISDAGVSNGLYEITITHPNGTKVSNAFTNIANKASGETYLIDEYLLGVMFANVITTTIKAYSTDIYVDCNGYSRVEIGNAATYATCTLLEPQPYTSWSNGSITFTQNTASITGSKYLYFIDSNNTPSVGMLLSGA